MMFFFCELFCLSLTVYKYLKPNNYKAQKYSFFRRNENNKYLEMKYYNSQKLQFGALKRQEFLNAETIFLTSQF